ncbi:hypothetical protein HYFRA_00003298 [Hymenoscyphus fraxineus]|uniref:Uncharacterized protein n=1 Tax=Hymenoscyphus fraxineus TaxID=746836 RepID=A0A9N9KW74_9HELO|nr:hypothetical protein HYFRA_00003298 [Hymenoscyphus fraxineus]
MLFPTSTVFAALSLASGVLGSTIFEFTCSNETRPITGLSYPNPRCCADVTVGHRGTEIGTNCTTADVSASSTCGAPVYDCANAILSGYGDGTCCSDEVTATSEYCFSGRLS